MKAFKLNNSSKVSDTDTLLLCYLPLHSSFCMNMWSSSAQAE